MTRERERAPVSGTGARTNQPAGQRDEHQDTDHPPRSVDVNRLRDGIAIVDNIAAVIAAELLGDAMWSLENLELRLAVLRSLDAAARQLTWAAA